MRRSDRATQARRHLERRYQAARLDDLRAVPTGGWVRAVRGALGMSQEALARRLGVTKPNVTKLEMSERNRTISLGKLAEIAEALDCTLVYALVPKTDLEDTVQRQARRVAADTLAYVETTMGLEDQAIGPDRLAEQLAIESSRVLDANRQWTAG